MKKIVKLGPHRVFFPLLITSILFAQKFLRGGVTVRHAIAYALIGVAVFSAMQLAEDSK